jgi:hypothetical protein
MPLDHAREMAAKLVCGNLGDLHVNTSITREPPQIARTVRPCSCSTRVRAGKPKTTARDVPEAPECNCRSWHRYRKNAFHVVGLDERGAVMLRQKWSRGWLEIQIANLPSCLVGMEASVGAHHLSRRMVLRRAVVCRPTSRPAPGFQGQLAVTRRSSLTQ